MDLLISMGIFQIIFLRSTEIDLDPLASEFSLKAIISGHGHEGPEYCCEWVNKSHSYIINGSKNLAGMFGRIVEITQSTHRVVLGHMTEQVGVQDKSG